MLAKSYNCGPSIGEYGDVFDKRLVLNLKNASHRGIFYHLLIEIWLIEVKAESKFPIEKCDDLRPRFNEFFEYNNYIQTCINDLDVDVTGDFTKYVNLFKNSSMIKNYLDRIIESKNIVSIMLEEEFNIDNIQNNSGLEIGLRGRPDCVILTSDEVLVIDWKTQIDDYKVGYYEIQIYFYIELVKNRLNHSNVKGRIISILQAHEKNKKFPALIRFDNYDYIDVEGIFIQTQVREKNPGYWCIDCKYNFNKHNPCIERSKEDTIVKNTKLLFDNYFHPSDFFDIEVSTNHLSPRKNNKWIYSTDGENEVTFIIRNGKFSRNQFIRLSGYVKTLKNNERIFYSNNFVVF